jgi:hypothetical protein
METFFFMGSKGGAGRTRSSLLFAAGASALGLSPLHIQVMIDGRPPALDGVTESPFVMEWVASEANPAPAVIEGCVAQHPTCVPIIVDMPAQRIRGSFIARVGTRILLPMRGGSLEIRHAARDYRDGEDLYGNWIEFGYQTDLQHPPIWLLPIGWPSGLTDEDYAQILCRRCALRDATGSVRVVRPGVPYFDLLDLDFVDDGRFTLADEQWDAARHLACGILNSTKDFQRTGEGS